jgi:hypothetical protein
MLKLMCPIYWTLPIFHSNVSNLFSLPRHCKICQFDLCEKCCQPQRSTLHLHTLYKANTELIYQRFSGGWRCDSCASRFLPTTNKFPYHCDICEFDLCDNCMRITDSKGMKPPLHPQNTYIHCFTSKGCQNRLFHRRGIIRWLTNFEKWAV